MDIRILPARPSDLAAIKLFIDTTLRRNFHDHHVSDETVIIGAINEIMEGIRSAVQGRAGKNRYFVAVHGKRIIATIGYGEANNLIRSYLEADFNKVKEIKTVYIDTAYRKQGLGRRLFLHILELMHRDGIGYACLDCGWRFSQGFWKHLLGEPARVVTDYWGKGSHAMIWKLEIAGFLQFCKVRPESQARPEG